MSYALGLVVSDMSFSSLSYTTPCKWSEPGFLAEGNNLNNLCIAYPHIAL